MSDNEIEEKEDLSNPNVVTKYKIAGEITNEVMKMVIEKCVDGASIIEVCEAADNMILEKAGTFYKKNKDLKKGIAFPTCISVNNVVGHFSPCPEKPKAPDADDPAITAALKTGDLVKIDLGAHMDGYAAVSAHSLVVGGAAEGKNGDVLAAAQAAAELAHRMMKPGNKNTPITEMFSKVAEEFGVNVVHGVLSHVMNRHVIDGDKVILSKADEKNKVDEVEFEPNEVYCIDIVMSTGSGKPINTSEHKPTVYKRIIDANYSLKMKASRAVFSHIKNNAPTFPFSIRSFPKDLSSRFGIKEMLNHNLVQAYPVLTEPDGVTAQVKFTVLLAPGNTMRITNSEYAPHSSEKTLKDPELVKLMQTSTGKKKKKKNNKKKKKAPAAAE